MYLVGLVSSEKRSVWHPVSLAQESTEEKIPWLQLRKQALQQMGIQVQSWFPHNLLCWTWEDGMDGRNFNTGSIRKDGGIPALMGDDCFIHSWMLEIISSRFFATSWTKTWWKSIKFGEQLNRMCQISCLRSQAGGWCVFPLTTVFFAVHELISIGTNIWVWFRVFSRVKSCVFCGCTLWLRILTPSLLQE